MHKFGWFDNLLKEVASWPRNRTQIVDGVKTVCLMLGTIALPSFSADWCANIFWCRRFFGDTTIFCAADCLFPWSFFTVIYYCLWTVGRRYHRLPPRCSYGRWRGAAAGINCRRLLCNINSLSCLVFVWFASQKKPFE